MQKGKGHSRNYTTQFVAEITPRRLERRTPKLVCGRPRNFCDPASSQHHNSGRGGGGGGGGMFTLKKLNQPNHSYVLYQPTHQFGGASLKAPWSYFCHKLGSVIS